MTDLSKYASPETSSLSDDPQPEQRVEATWEDETLSFTGHTREAYQQLSAAFDAMATSKQAGGNGYTFANPIGAVLSNLDIKLL